MSERFTEEPISTPDIILDASTKMIEVPRELQSQPETRADEATTEVIGTEAAQRMIGMPPGYKESAVVEAAPRKALGGRSGLGMTPVDMPTDPTNVPGWNGQTKR